MKNNHEKLEREVEKKYRIKDKRKTVKMKIQGANVKKLQKIINDRSQ